MPPPDNDRQYHIDPKGVGRYPEPNHVDVSRLDNYRGSLGKKGLCIKMINVTQQILKFRDFLVHAWPDLDLLMSNHDWDDDVAFMDEWVKVNWEYLVERELLGKGNYLLSYTATNVRVTKPEAKANYKIVCVHKSEPSEKTLEFGGFNTKLSAGGYGRYPPFDYVTVYFVDKKRNFKELPVADCEFFLVEIDQE